ncbi:unnamed protein product [Amoebophrya sp. A120]|nr:unnamed protein product [Amoebophrya sp. A120]|eukprot:GSA120T00009533001.1
MAPQSSGSRMSLGLLVSSQKHAAERDETRCILRDESTCLQKEMPTMTKRRLLLPNFYSSPTTTLLAIVSAANLFCSLFLPTCSALSVVHTRTGRGEGHATRSRVFTSTSSVNNKGLFISSEVSSGREDQRTGQEFNFDEQDTSAGRSDSTNTLLNKHSTSSNIKSTLLDRSLSSINEMLEKNWKRKDVLDNLLHTHEHKFTEKMQHLRKELQRQSSALSQIALEQAESRNSVDGSKSEIARLRRRYKLEVEEQCGKEVDRIGKEKKRKLLELKDRREMYAKYFGKRVRGQKSNETKSSAASSDVDSSSTSAVLSSEPCCPPYDEDTLDFLIGETEDALQTHTEEQESKEKQCENQRTDLNNRIAALQNEEKQVARKMSHTEQLRKRYQDMKKGLENELAQVKRDFNIRTKSLKEERSGLASSTCTYTDVRNQVAQEQTFDCEMTPWKPKSLCTKQCRNGKLEKPGKMLLTREILRNSTQYGISCFADGKNGKKSVLTATEKEVSCNDVACPVDCKLGDWTDWSDCSAICGFGTTMRTREVLQTPLHGGKVCPAVQERKPCNPNGACDKDCTVSESWEPLTTEADGKVETGCSRACGGGVLKFEKKIKEPAKGSEGQCLRKWYEKTESCNEEACTSTSSTSSAEEAGPGGPVTSNSTRATTSSPVQFQCGARNVVLIVDQSGSMNDTEVSSFRNQFRHSMMKQISDYTDHVRFAELAFGNTAASLPEPKVKKSIEKAQRDLVTEYTADNGGASLATSGVDGNFLQLQEHRAADEMLADQERNSLSSSLASSATGSKTSSSRTPKMNLGFGTHVASALKKARDLFQEIHSSRKAGRKLREAELAKVPGGVVLANRVKVNLKLNQPEGSDVIVVFSDCKWSRKHLIHEEMKKFATPSANGERTKTTQVLLVLGGGNGSSGEKVDTAKNEILEEEYVPSQHVFAATPEALSGKNGEEQLDLFTNILSGICPKVLAMNAAAGGTTGSVGSSSTSTGGPSAAFMLHGKTTADNSYLPEPHLQPPRTTYTTKQRENTINTALEGTAESSRSVMSDVRRAIREMEHL